MTLERYASLEKHDLDFYLHPLDEIVPGPLLSNQLGLYLPGVFIVFLAGLAIVIMLSAAFNYTSLSIAHSLLRSKEYGLRKSIGASRKQLIFQIMIEALLVTFFAMILAFGLLQFLLPAFSGMKMMSLLEIDPRQTMATYAAYLGFALLTGLLSGLFPAIYVSAFNPVKVLKADAHIKILKRLSLRRILLVTQYTFSIIFLISIILIYRQMRFMLNEEMGFNTEMTYTVSIYGKDPEQVKDQFSKVPEVSTQSFVSHIPGIGQVREVDVKNPGDEEEILSHYFAVDPAFVGCMGLELLAGRDFPEELAGKNETFTIVNETALETFRLGSPSEAIGKTVVLDDSIPVEVIGVIKDFQYVALFLNQKSLFLRHVPGELNYALMHINSADMPATIEKLDSRWEEIDPIHPMEGGFLNQEIREYYDFFEDVVYSVGFATILAIVVASLGLFGMATYTIQVKLREISIRKVYGSSSRQVIFLVSKSFMRLLLIAALLGIPLGFLINNTWLSQLARQVSLGPGNLLAGALIVILLGFFTIWSQTLRAARTNPSETLRNE